MIEEIEPTQSSPASEAAVAAYAAMLAARGGDHASAQAPGGGGSLQRPDAIVLVGGRDNKAAKMREQAETLRAQAERMKSEGATATVQGEQIKTDADKEIGEAQRALTDARTVETAAQGRVQSADGVQHEADALSHEAEVAQTQSDDATRRAQNVRQRADLMISIGESGESRTTTEQGFQLMQEAGQMEGEARLQYEKSSGRSRQSQDIANRAASIRREGGNMLITAQGQVSAAEGRVQGGNHRKAQGEKTRDDGQRRISAGDDLVGKAALLDSQAEMFAGMAASIPYYIVPH